MELPGHCRLAGVARGSEVAEEVHGGRAARGSGTVEAGPHGAVEQQRRGLHRPSQIGGDVQGHVVPRRRGDARGCGVAVTASPRSAPPHEFSHLSSPFPYLLCFRHSIKPALDFCHLISPQFPRSLCFPLDFPPARSISCTVLGRALTSSSMASRGCFGCPGGRLAPEAAIHILARRGGHLPPRGRLDA
ncbi:hypothetical protein PVAP13_5NG383801 [Panicum virgatum]|uniref:Uncharacterized protein n=1 Tax=Panicum virgatum TaxID=38727 RepID=A0A8T0RTI2_PANVG|nr:hypothetical protein PVAP13_5NG383801 [Panicum virgatum]